MPRRIRIPCLSEIITSKPWLTMALVTFCLTVCPLAALAEDAAVSLTGSRNNVAGRDRILGGKAEALSRFDDSLLVAETEVVPRSIRAIMKDLETLERDYLDKLEDTRSSYGLFASGAYDHDTLNAETRSTAGLEWRIFNDGYFEAVRRDSQKILQTQLEFYQMREDMIARRLDEDLHQLATLENCVNLAYTEEKSSALAALLEKRSHQLQHGYTTGLDVLNLDRQLRDARHSAAYYRSTPRSGLSREQQDLLNDLEHIGLKPGDELVRLAEAHSYLLKIQDAFISRSDFFPAWADDIAVNLEAGYTHEYYDRERHTLGIEVEIPLTLDTDRASLVDTQKRIFRYQKEAVTRRLQQQVEKLRSFYSFQQQRLLAQQDNILLLLKMREDNRRKEQDSIQKSEDDPTRNLELLEVNIIDARYEALLTRLKLYEMILKLLALTQGPEITSLFVFD